MAGGRGSGGGDIELDGSGGGEAGPRPLEVLAADLVGHVALVDGQDGDLVRRQLEHLEDEAGLVAVQLEELGDGVLR